MKLRQTPGDFRVIELLRVKIVERGPYKIYKAEKSGIESFQMLNHLSRKYGIPVTKIGISGLKDKHACTEQYFSVPSDCRSFDFIEPKLKVAFIGYSLSNIKPGFHERNNFLITVRDLSLNEALKAIENSKWVAEQGVPNYFDSQRFGSLIKRDFIAKRIIQKDYEAALRIYLTEYSKSEKKEVKDDKRCIAANWGQFAGIKVKSKMAHQIIDCLNRTGSWLLAYNAIPKSIREMHLLAFQSFLWNECVKSLLIDAIPKPQQLRVKYAAGTLIFAKAKTPYLKKPLSFKTISPNQEFSDYEKSVVRKVLQEHGLTIDDFNIGEKSGISFRSYERQVFIKPISLEAFAPEVDELNSEGKRTRYKLLLSFGLPKGSYATIITKSIFQQ